MPEAPGCCVVGQRCAYRAARPRGRTWARRHALGSAARGQADCRWHGWGPASAQARGTPRSQAAGWGRCAGWGGGVGKLRHAEVHQGFVARDCVTAALRSTRPPSRRAARPLGCPASLPAPDRHSELIDPLHPLTGPLLRATMSSSAAFRAPWQRSAGGVAGPSCRPPQVLLRAAGTDFTARRPSNRSGPC